MLLELDRRPVNSTVMPLTLNSPGKMFRMVALTALLISMAAVNAQNRHWRSLKRHNLITFDWNCARNDWFPKATLSQVVYRSIEPEDRGLSGVWADRAFILRPTVLGKIYFVPTVCGATGNCTWQLYSLNPTKYLGEISGQFIYTYKSSGLPVIITYTHMSASEGILATFVARRGRYRWLGDEYPIGYEIQPGLRTNGHKMPSFIERAARQCKNYGG